MFTQIETFLIFLTLFFLFLHAGVKYYDLKAYDTPGDAQRIHDAFPEYWEEYLKKSEKLEK